MSRDDTPASEPTSTNFGDGDATYRAVGSTDGVRELVDAFYNQMGTNADYKTIWDMHPDDRDTSRDKLTRFLCAWMGGPRLYNEKYGSISIPGAHAHLPITEDEKTLWLNCMQDALHELEHDQALIDYLLIQFAVPASRIVSACAPEAKNQ